MTRVKLHWQEMAANPRNPDRAALAGPLDLNASPSVLAIWGLAFLLLYGYELFNFSLSIDEELHTFGSDWPLSWLQQGRWGMAILSRSLPPYPRYPSSARPYLVPAFYLRSHISPPITDCKV